MTFLNQVESKYDIKGVAFIKKSPTAKNFVKLKTGKIVNF